MWNGVSLASEQRFEMPQASDLVTASAKWTPKNRIRSKGCFMFEFNSTACTCMIGGRNYGSNEIYYRYVIRTQRCGRLPPSHQHK